MIEYSNGSLVAFELLYTRHKGSTYRYFLRQCDQRNTAEDLLQELWSKVIKSKEKYKEQALFTTWLYRIAHNLVVDHQRRFRLIEPQEDHQPPQTNDQPEANLNQQQLANKLDSCLKKLPSTQLEAFLLHQETDLTLTQIAQIITTSLEATKSRLRYAIKALRQCLRLEREE